MERSDTPGCPDQKLTVDPGRDALVVAAGAGTVRIRYVELDREVEGDEDDVDEQPRISAELHVELAEAVGDIPAKKWVKFVDVYTHDSYDGKHLTVVEDATVNRTVFRAVVSSLDVTVSLEELLALVAKHTEAKASFLALVKLLPEDESFDVDEIEIVEEAEPATVARQEGSVEELLAKAQVLIDQGVARKESVLYAQYDEKVARQFSPSFLEAEAILAQIDEIDPTGQGHALRAAWFEGLEPGNFPQYARETAKAWNNAVEASPERLDWRERAAFAHLRARAGAKAVPHLNKLIAADKSDPHLYYLRARAYDAKPPRRSPSSSERSRSIPTTGATIASWRRT